MVPFCQFPTLGLRDYFCRKTRSGEINGEKVEILDDMTGPGTGTVCGSDVQSGKWTKTYYWDDGKCRKKCRCDEPPNDYYTVAQPRQAVLRALKKDVGIFGGKDEESLAKSRCGECAVKWIKKTEDNKFGLDSKKENKLPVEHPDEDKSQERENLWKTFFDEEETCKK